MHAIATIAEQIAYNSISFSPIFFRIYKIGILKLFVIVSQSYYLYFVLPGKQLI